MTIVVRALMEEVLAIARSRSCRCAWLAVDEDSDAALALYASVGGQPPERQIHIDFDLDRRRLR